MSRARGVNAAGRRAIGALSAVAMSAVVLASSPAPANALEDASGSANGANAAADAWGSADVADAAADTSGSADGANAAADDELARGLIVKTTSGGVSVRALATASENALADSGVVSDVAVGVGVAPRTRLLEFDEPVTVAEAEQVARDVALRPDVVWAVPDRRVYLAADVTVPNDPRFSEQWNVWDTSRPDGGYSVRAPAMWSRTAGSPSVVVAVIDSGVTAHPDLDANLVGGYDFVSDFQVANDGDGRDANPADPGDWITGAEAAFGYFKGCEITGSSWHGTHVAGIVAAIRDNAVGISGVAPGVRVQPLRAMGKCGGYTSDVIAAMTWAAGGDVPGVPPNPTPAKVINLSLGSTDSCSRAEQEAIDFALSRGVTVVVAAGNEKASVETSSPANCRGVISVSAVARNGARASYSNVGKAPGDMTIAAPGGDLSRDGGILSTYNSGSQSPGAPIYAYQPGTSMAAPHVSAAAALAYSLGASTPDEVQRLLIETAQPFPSGVSNACTVTLCGAGIVDLGRLANVMPGKPDSPVDVAVSAGDRRANVSWSSPERTGGSAVVSYVATAQPGGASCTTASTSCTISGLTNGTTYSVSVTATNASGFTSLPSSTVDVTPKAAVALAGAVTNVIVTWRGTERGIVAVVRWSPPLNAEVDEYRARLARIGGGYGSWTYLSDPVVRVTDLRSNRAYRVQIQAGNSAGWGTSLVVRLRP